MSDLQCPARIIVARHGEATYDQPDVLTDAGGWLTETGRAQAAELAERLADERVAAVYSSRLARAEETAAIVADRLGLPSAAVDGVEELRVGELEGAGFGDPRGLECFRAWIGGDLSRRWPGAQTGQEMVDRFAAAVDALADQHRGETVVLVSHGGIMSLGITHTAGNVPVETRRRTDVANCATAVVEVDADGWRLVSPWPGREFAG